MFRPMEALFEFLGGGSIQIEVGGLWEGWCIAIPVKNQMGSPLFSLMGGQVEQLKEIVGLAELNAAPLEP